MEALQMNKSGDRQKQQTYGFSKRMTLLLMAGVTILLAVGCVAGFFLMKRQAEELGQQIVGLQTQLEEIETQRIEDAYTFQRKLESISVTGSGDAAMTGEDGQDHFAAALRDGKIKSVLIIGDSISEGNGDTGFVYPNQRTEDMGLRKIMETEEGTYYEGEADSQGWVKYFRNYLLENTSVEKVTNNAIGGKSALWGNEHKEAWITEDYDAIFVMLGTNDRYDCTNQQEFYVALSQFLEYAASRCTYLTVFAPIPALDNASSPPNMSSHQIADTVVNVCENNGYDCVNLYLGMMEYTAALHMSLDEMLYGSTHPSSRGYLHLWRLIAMELGLNAELADFYDANLSAEEITLSVRHIGYQPEGVAESTSLHALDEGGNPLFAIGDTVCQVDTSFCEEAPYGADLVTHRYEDGTGYQILKPDLLGNDYIRYAGVDGTWGEWTAVHFDAYPES